jgi:hypothetical protein
MIAIMLLLLTGIATTDPASTLLLIPLYDDDWLPPSLDEFSLHTACSRSLFSKRRFEVSSPDQNRARHFGKGKWADPLKYL